MAYKSSYTKEALEKALSAVKRRTMSLRQASVEYRVPRSTLSDHNHKEITSVGARGRRRELSDQEESALVGYITDMANQGVPCSRGIIRTKVVKMLEKSGTSTRINMSTGPTDKWFRGFLARNNLSNRLAENMDPARAAQSTQVVMDEFFDFYTKLVNDLGIADKPDQIFNCDETGWTGKERSTTKVIAPKKGHVMRRKTASHGGHITANICVSASGQFLPSLVIFQGCVPHRPITDVPPTWLFTASDSGFINSDIFYQWFIKCFIPHCGKARPVLLVINNHDSHVSIKTVQAALDNGIVLAGLPAHTTHILQPLDVKIFGPLKSRFASICHNLGHTSSSIMIGKSSFPAILRYTIDQTSPAAVQRAFAVTETSELRAQTCPTCGNFTMNPLVARGIVPERLAKVLLPPPTKPMEEKHPSRKRIEKGRVLSKQDLLDELKVQGISIKPSTVAREKMGEEKRLAPEKRKKEAEERKLANEEEARMKKERRETEKK